MRTVLQAVYIIMAFPLMIISDEPVGNLIKLGREGFQRNAIERRRGSPNKFNLGGHNKLGQARVTINLIGVGGW